MIRAARALVVAAALLATGAAAVTVMRVDPPPATVPDAPWQPGSALDGRAFHTVDTIIETGEVLRDVLHFADGRFQSAMCQEYCDFGWTEYRTWAEGAVIHFTTTTRCPDAPHTVVWHGQVTGDAIRFEATWTTRRWYWTRQINAVGEGSTTPPPESDVTG